MTPAEKLSIALREFIEPILVAQIESTVRRVLGDQVAAIETATQPTPGRETLGYSEVHTLYGIGRDEWNRLINSGELKATARRMRGGRSGWVVHRAEAARVLAGRP